MAHPHPFEVMTSPDGADIKIDVMMVPLIRALWDAGYKTIMCCQDKGQYIGEDFDPRVAAYLMGYADIFMPLADGCRLLSLASSSPRFSESVLSGGLGTLDYGVGFNFRDMTMTGDILIRFPKDRIGELAELAASQART